MYSANAEGAEDEHHDDDEAYEIDDFVHDSFCFPAAKLDVPSERAVMGRVPRSAVCARHICVLRCEERLALSTRHTALTTVR
jgi:hypothetical protein